MVKFKYFKNLKKQANSIFKNQSEKIISTLELLVNVVCYGFVLNLILLSFFNFDLNFLNLFSLGFSWYFLSAEIPIVVEKYRGRQQ